MKKKQTILPQTKKTPEVVLDKGGTIRLSGRLIPENAEEFFSPVEVWINEYFCDPAPVTTLDFDLEYINSSGFRHMFYLVHKIINIRLLNDPERFRVNWYYRPEDEDMLEKGKLLSQNLNVPFSFIQAG